jgi:hypothetical protein
MGPRFVLPGTKRALELTRRHDDLWRLCCVGKLVAAASAAGMRERVNSWWNAAGYQLMCVIGQFNKGFSLQTKQASFWFPRARGNVVVRRLVVMGP